MQLIKFTHSCIRLQEGENALVIDPGVFSELDMALDGADAVLITHEHPDHVDAPRLTAAARANSALRIYAPASVAAALELGEQVTSVTAGDIFSTADFTVETFGGQHALIHPLIPIVANVGYLIDGRVYHPGDSLIVPPKPVRTLLAPLHAPWSKLSEVIDFAISVHAPHVYQIHDGLLHERAFPIVEGNLVRLTEPHGITYAHLDVKQAVDA